MARRELDRRTFVGGLAAAGAVAAVPRELHALSGRTQPSQKLRIACIGVGGMGHTDVRGVSGEELVAFADVDWKSAERAFREFPKARRYKDFREMLEKERNNIDAVTVSTPRPCARRRGDDGAEAGEACLHAEAAGAHDR